MRAFSALMVPSVLWRCWLGGRKGIRPVKNWVVGCWHGCLGWGADLHIAQQMPLPLTTSCSSKSRLVLTFLVLPFCLLTRVVPDIFQKSSKTVVCEEVNMNMTPIKLNKVTKRNDGCNHLLASTIQKAQLLHMNCRTVWLSLMCFKLNTNSPKSKICKVPLFSEIPNPLKQTKT